MSMSLTCFLHLKSSSVTNSFISSRSLLKTHFLREAFFDNFVWKFTLSDIASVRQFVPPHHHCFSYYARACRASPLAPHLSVASTRAGIWFTAECPVPGPEQGFSIYRCLIFFPFFSYFHIPVITSLSRLGITKMWGCLLC